jgi:transcriptional regulator with XRE-family HTH domain
MALSPIERKAALLLAGRTQQSVAREAGVSPGLVSRVLNNRHRHAGVESVIAKAIARPRDEVFAVGSTGASRSLRAAGAA